MSESAFGPAADAADDRPWTGEEPRQSTDPLPPEVTKTDLLTEPLVHSPQDMMVYLVPEPEDKIEPAPEGWTNQFCGMCGEFMGMTRLEDAHNGELLKAHWPNCKNNVDLNA
jgi:hypothetical protein